MRNLLVVTRAGQPLAESNPPPIHTYSEYRTMVVGSAAFLFLFGLGLFWLLFYDVERGFLVIVIGTFFLPSVYDTWSHPVRKASFYEDHLIVSGRKLHRDVKYSEIQEISKRRRFLVTAVTLRVKDEVRLLAFPNESNRKLKMDLYTWLTQRRQQQT